MLDFTKIKFIVDRIEDNGYFKNYVMKPTPDIHTGTPTLIGEDGKEYPVYMTEKRFLSEESEYRLVENKFEFYEGEDPQFEIGTVLTMKEPEWKQGIPKSKPIRISYTEICHKWLTDEISYSIDLTVDILGNFKFIKKNSKEEIIKECVIDQALAQNYVDDMHQFLTRTDSYLLNIADHAARYIKYEFENGDSYEIPTICAYGEVKCGNYLDAADIRQQLLEHMGLNAY